VFPGTGIPMLPVARLGTAYYYAYFWIVLPLLGLLETPRPLPLTIATSVTGSGVEQVNAPAE
jgi:ubiquinol-cytochrome c reductase cytochrome b subunit